MPARTLTLERAARFTWRGLIVALGVYVLVVALARLRILVLPVIVAFLIATVMLPVVDWLHRRGLPRLVSVWLVLAGSIGLFIGLFFALAPSVQEEFADLGPTLEQGREDIEQYIIDSPFDISQEDLDEYVSSFGDQLSGRGTRSRAASSPGRSSPSSSSPASCSSSSCCSSSSRTASCSAGSGSATCAVSTTTSCAPSDGAHGRRPGAT
jgi:predicted PurR-regulated permease PerM